MPGFSPGERHLAGRTDGEYTEQRDREMKFKSGTVEQYN
jgi:hypothetical protein